MKYCYRGVSYEREPLSLEVTEGEIGGKYRGKEWKHHYPKHIPQLAPKSNLQYRGIRYNRYPAIQTEARKAFELAELSRQQIRRRKKPTQRTAQELTKAHLKNIRHNLEHRIQVAKSNGDENLVRILEEEGKELTLSM